MSSGIYCIFWINGKNQTSLSGKVRWDQPAKQLHSYHDENHFQERYISSDIVSILIQDLSSFKDDSSVAFSMACSAICLLVKSNTVPFVSAGIQPTLYQYSSSRLISVSIGLKWISITGHSSLVPVSEHTNVDPNVDCYYSDTPVYYRQCYIAHRKSSSVYIIRHQVVLH